MQRLRTSTRLIRLLMAWFALALGVAAAAPVLHPQSVQFVCAAQGGMKLVALGEDTDATPAGHATLQCPACLAVLPPPSPLQLAMRALSSPSVATWSVRDVHSTRVAGAPLPPRGPPRQG